MVYILYYMCMRIYNNIYKRPISNIDETCCTTVNSAVWCRDDREAPVITVRKLTRTKYEYFTERENLSLRFADERSSATCTPFVWVCFQFSILSHEVVIAAVIETGDRQPITHTHGRHETRTISVLQSGEVVYTTILHTVVVAY